MTKSDILEHIQLEKNVNDDEYEYENNLLSCYLCNSILVKSKKYLTYIYEEKIKTNTCYLCHMVVNFKKFYIDHVLIGFSELDQLKINNMTLEYCLKNNTIPLPNEIDKKVELIKIQSFEFACLCDNDKTSKNTFKKYKIFFTDEIKKHVMNCGKNMFSNTEKTEKKPMFDTSYYNLPIYKMSKNEEQLFAQLKKNKKYNNENIIKSMDKKQKKVQMMIELQNKLNKII